MVSWDITNIRTLYGLASLLFVVSIVGGVLLGVSTANQNEGENNIMIKSGPPTHLDLLSNNLSTGIYSVMAPLGIIYLIINGVNIGFLASQGVVLSQDVKFLLVFFPHIFIEIPALLLFVASGLRIVMDPIRFFRNDCNQIVKEESISTVIRIIFIASILMTIAVFVEIHITSIFASMARSSIESV